jgi:hypothetical protein
MTTPLDPRWQLLRNRSWTCASCKQEHQGLFDLGCRKPDYWTDDGDAQPNSAVVGSTHCLTEDFCIVNGESYFVRGLLRLPLVGDPDRYFAFGVWSSLAQPNFERYVETFDDATQNEIGPWFGWFSNSLKAYPDTRGLKCRVRPQPHGQRPWIELHDADHPLVKDSREGITYERLLAIYAANGHPMA